MAQILSTASNLYLLNDSLPTRTYSLICGGVFSTLCFLPNFRHYRWFVLVGLLATFYTACFLTINAGARGPIESVDYDTPRSLEKFFTGFTDLVFMLGTSTAAVEKADVMDKPKLYDIAYVWATIYVYVITLPTGIAGFHTFGLTAQDNPNAFYMYAKSPARNLGVGLMCFHQFVAFGLFAGPLFHIWEKFLRVDKMNYWIKTSTRFMVCGFMVLFAVTFPFFGVINSVVGALTTTFGTFIIPAICDDPCRNQATAGHGPATRWAASP